MLLWTRALSSAAALPCLLLFSVLVSIPSVSRADKDRGAMEPPIAISEVRATANKIITCKSEGPQDPTTCATQCSVEPGDGTDELMAVEVEGDVSAASGKFAGSYEDKGFQLADGTGGIFVMTGHADFGLRRGERVRVSGTPHCLGGTLALDDTELGFPDSDSDSRRSKKNPVAFAPLQIGELRTEPDGIGAAQVVTPNWCDCLMPISYTEGDVITVRGTAVSGVVDDLPYGHKVFLDDGSGVGQVFIDSKSGIPVDRLARRLITEGADLCVTGVVAQFAAAGFEILPRTRRDIRRARPHRDNPCER